MRTEKDTDLRIKNQVAYIRKRYSFTKKLWITVLVLSGSTRLILDGDGFTGVYRHWHPITWMLWVVAFPLCAIYGERITDVMLLKKYWKERRSAMVFVPLRDFIHIWK